MTIDGQRHRLTATADQLKDVASKNFTPDRINNPAQDEDGRYQSGVTDIVWGNEEKKTDLSVLKTWTFDMDTETIQSPNGNIYDAFSGNQSVKNDPKYEGTKNIGPLPRGTYFIVSERLSANLFKQAAKKAVRFVNGTYFALYKNDGEINDRTTVYDPLSKKMVERDGFRLHGGEHSNGCVTVDKQQFKALEKELEDGSTTKIKDADSNQYHTAYGILIIKGTDKVEKPQNQKN